VSILPPGGIRTAAEGLSVYWMCCLSVFVSHCDHAAPMENRCLSVTEHGAGLGGGDDRTSARHVIHLGGGSASKRNGPWYLGVGLASRVDCISKHYTRLGLAGSAAECCGALGGQRRWRVREKSWDALDGVITSWVAKTAARCGCQGEGHENSERERRPLPGAEVQCEGMLRRQAKNRHSGPCRR
jgi:hypothetical protein